MAVKYKYKRSKFQIGNSVIRRLQQAGIEITDERDELEPKLPVNHTNKVHAKEN